MTHRILILGGTTEARHIAGPHATRVTLSVTLSLAGRTESPVAQGVPVRSGGFGGADGLAAYLRETGTDLMVDATHPYAAQISANAAQAARPDKPLFLTLKSDLSLALDNDAVDRAGLSASLDRATSGDKQQRVFLRSDKTVPYGELMTLMNELRGAGYLHVALVGLEADKVSP